MAKIYTDNHKLILAQAKIFGSLDADSFEKVFDVVKLSSGEYLPKSKMIVGKYPVYGGGGITENYHNEYNVAYNTIGIGRVGARCGCVFKISEFSWVTDNALYATEIDKEFDIYFLIHYLNYANLNQYANTAAQPVISLKRISNVLIPKVDLEKQRKIGQILNDLQEGNFDLDEDEYGLSKTLRIEKNISLLKNELTHQQTLLKQLRQAILHEAVQGKLTEQWRKENSEVEPASVLLEKIKGEKAKLIKEGKLKKQKPLPPISQDEISFALPEGWAWCRMNEIGLFERGKSKHRPRNDARLFSNGTIPFVQTGDVAQSKNSHYLINSASSFYNEFGLNQSRLWKKGTLCITIAANIAETGFLNIDACFPDSVVGFTPLKNFTISRYLRYFLELTRTDIEAFAPATAQKNINLGIINELVFPLPPAPEQQAIVEKVESLLAKVSQLEEEVQQNQQRAEQLLQSVLREVMEPKERITSVEAKH